MASHPKTSNPKPPKPPPTAAVSPELKAQIDELGALEEELAPIQPKLKRITLLRKAVAEAADAVIPKPGDSRKLDGGKYVALVGPRKSERFIKSMAKVFNIVTKAVFLANCSMALKKVEELVPDPQQQAQLIGCGLTGSRSVDTYKIAA